MNNESRSKKASASRKKESLDRRYYGVPELARAYNVSDQSIYNLLNAGVIKSVRFGRRRLIPAEDEPKLEALFKIEL